MGEFIKVAKAADIRAGFVKGFVVGENRIMIANVGGKYYALEDKCPHMGAKLSEGILLGSTIMCMAHNAQFDVLSGQSLAGVTNKSARAYEVRVNGEDIEVKV